MVRFCVEDLAIGTEKAVQPRTGSKVGVLCDLLADGATRAMPNLCLRKKDLFVKCKPPTSDNQSGSHPTAAPTLSAV